MRALGTGLERIARIRVSAEKFSAGHRVAVVDFNSAVQQIPDAVKTGKKRWLFFTHAHCDPKYERALVGHVLPAR